MDGQEAEAKRVQKVAKRRLHHVQLAKQRLADHIASRVGGGELQRPALSIAHDSSAEAPLRGYVYRSSLFGASVICIMPFTVLRGSLSQPLLEFLQGAPEWFRSYDEWAGMREPDARLMGFEQSPPAVEMYAHCHSQVAPMANSQQYLYSLNV